MRIPRLRRAVKNERCRIVIISLAATVARALPGRDSFSIVLSPLFLSLPLFFFSLSRAPSVRGGGINYTSRVVRRELKDEGRETAENRVVESSRVESVEKLVGEESRVKAEIIKESGREKRGSGAKN